MSLADRWITFFNKPIPNVILRLVVLFGGFLSMAMSIALMRTTGLGNSPISCIPATLSYLVPLTLGTITFIMNTCFLVVQAILLRRDFNTTPSNGDGTSWAASYSPWECSCRSRQALSPFPEKASFLPLQKRRISLSLNARSHSTAPWLWFPLPYPS